jgi:hypothetical protein
MGKRNSKAFPRISRMTADKQLQILGGTATAADSTGESNSD